MANTFLSVDILLFAITAALFTKGVVATASSSSSSTPKTCDATSGSSSSLKNSAFVFIKPHANTVAVQELVRNKLLAVGCNILTEIDIDGPTIDKKKLIDQHYYAIASKATILPAKDIPVPKDKFQEAFGESWDQVLKEERACNALDALDRFQCLSDALNKAWQDSKVVKLGGGFYCGLVTINNKSLYVFNAFFMTMRSKFVGADVSIHCFEVEFDPANLSWSSFRNEVLGPTDPADGPVGSLRRTILDQYQQLGLQSKPDKGDNGVHASASPFEGLAEKVNWLSRSVEQDAFGKALLAAGLSIDTIQNWSVDPQIVIDLQGNKGSIFDALEDLNVQECYDKLLKFNEFNAFDVI